MGTIRNTTGVNEFERSLIVLRVHLRFALVLAVQLVRLVVMLAAAPLIAAWLRRRGSDPRRPGRRPPARRAAGRRRGTGPRP